MNKIPDKLLLRRNEVLQCLGIDNRTLSKFVEAGVITQIHIKSGRKKGYAFYRRVDVVKLAGTDQAEQSKQEKEHDSTE